MRASAAHFWPYCTGPHPPAQPTGGRIIAPPFFIKKKRRTVSRAALRILSLPAAAARKAEQLGKIAFQARTGGLLDQARPPGRRGSVLYSGFEDLPDRRAGLDDADQQDAQHGAADQLADAHGDAVGDAGQPEGCAGSGVREHHRDLDADDDGIEDHRGQRGCDGQTLEADVPQLVGHEAGQQGGQRAEDDVHDGGTEQVCEEAAQHHAEDVLCAEHRQQAEGLGHTHLHRAVRERLQRHAEHDVEGCDHAAAGQFTDRKVLILHTITPAV